MARITSVATHGLKGTDRTVELDRCNLILGPVGSGKSTILDAIRFGALGHVPALGKTEAVTAKLMRESLMEVVLAFDNGSDASRRLESAGQGKFRGDAEASWLPPKTKSLEAGKKISALFGDSDQEAAENLDLRELLNGSANKRSERIEALLDATGLGPEDLIKRGVALLRLRAAGIAADRIPDDIGEAHETAAGVDALMPREIRSVIGDVIADLRDKLASGGIRNANEHMRNGKLNHGAAVKQKVAARAELEDRITNIEESADSLTDLATRREQTAKHLAGAERDLQAAEDAARARSGAESALPALREAAEQAAALLEQATAALPTAESKRAEVEAIEDPPEMEAPDLVPTDPQALEEVNKLEERAKALTREADGIEVPTLITTQTELARVGDLQARLSAAESSPWNRVRQIAHDIIEQFPLEADELMTMAGENAGTPVQIRNDLAIAERELKAAEEKALARSEDRQAALERIRDLREKVDALRKQANAKRREAEGASAEVNARARKQHADALAARTATVRENRERRTRLRTEAQRIEHAAVEAQAKADKAAADLKALESRLDGMAEVTADPEKAKATIESATKDLVDLDARIVALRQADVRRQEMADLLDEIDRATALEQAYKSAEWACQRLREEDLKARAGGLVERLRVFLRAAGRQEEPYLRASRGKCDFGWRLADGKEVAVEALSGGEAVLFCAGLSAAVIAMRSPEIKALLIEGAELGAAEPAHAIMRGCLAIADQLDTVIVATNADIEPLEGWNVIRCGAKAAEEVAA